MLLSAESEAKWKGWRAGRKGKEEGRKEVARRKVWRVRRDIVVLVG